MQGLFCIDKSKFYSLKFNLQYVPKYRLKTLFLRSINNN